MKYLKTNLLKTILISILFFGCNDNKSEQYSESITIGLQTYSFRTMDDESPLAILEYIKQTGIKNVELMGNHAEPFAGIPQENLSRDERRLLYKLYRNEDMSEQEKANAEILREKRNLFEEKISQWRKEVDFEKFRELKRLYDQAGINIYGFKPRVFEKENSDEDIRYGMRAAIALGATHVTLEHPDDDLQTQRLANIAKEENILIGYHGHEQQTPTFWDNALQQSDYNRMNLDFGHYIAGGNENVLEFVREKNDKIINMHLKDRNRISNGGDNLSWGEGETPIIEVLNLIKEEGYTFPVTIELEYDIPADSNTIQEVINCLNYIKKAIGSI